MTAKHNTPSEAAFRAMKILKYTYIPGISERYAKTDEGYLVLKDHLQDEQLYYDDYKSFRKNPNSIKYSYKILTVIQNMLIKHIPEYHTNDNLAPLILRFLNKEYPCKKRYDIGDIRFAYEIYETCVDIEREKYVYKRRDNDDDDENILNHKNI